jgi:superfamily II DNA or RNA helicase
MKIELYEYQKKTYDLIIDKLYNKKVKRLVVVLPTGGGKSVIIGKLASILPGRTLVLTHRIEILTQNAEWLSNAGLLSSDINTLRYDNKIVIAMVQTLYARIIKYGIKYVGEFDNIILDEVQVLIFEKVFKKYDYKHLIGFTGTPVLNKKKYTTIDGVEFVEPYTLSEIFDDLVCGPDTKELIELGYLVQDYNIVLKLPNFDKLKESDSSPDGYTKKSLDEVYKNTASLNVLSEAYEKHCKGKKTLIFNASTSINEFVYKHFKKKGLNVKMFDSVNSVEINPKTSNKYKRDEIIEWFNNEKDAILINTNVFTTGFNVTDVEVVVVNRATKSLALWIQMVGRGSRTTTKIYKDKFTVIDLGQNVYEHGMWSAKRNWKDYFYSPGKKPKNNVDLLDVWTCEFCGALTIKGEIKCCVCDKEKTNAIINGVGKKHKDGELEMIQEMPLPKAKVILLYTIAMNQDANFAFKLLETRILELFIHYKVSSRFYNTRKREFTMRVEQIYVPIYFAIIKSGLPGSNKKLGTQLAKMHNKINKLYNH